VNTFVDTKHDYCINPMCCAKMQRLCQRLNGKFVPFVWGCSDYGFVKTD